MNESHLPRRTGIADTAMAHLSNAKPMSIHFLRTAVPLAFTLLLTACAVDGQRSGAPAPDPAASAASAPVAPPPPEPPPPPTPAQMAQAQKIAMAAVDLLEAGQEEQARVELERAVSLDPGNKLANSLIRQIAGDPVAMLGREHFTYRVQANDTLSRIAGRFMGDIYSFYILARYNDIKVPRQVAGGQLLRIPGKAPAPERSPRAAQPAPQPTPPAATPAPAAPPVVTAPAAQAEPTPGERAMRNAEANEKANRLDRALEDYRRAAEANQPGAAAKVEQVRKRLIDRSALAARTAFAKQDLAGAIRHWDNVLALDPAHETAKLERQKAVNLKARIDQLK